MNILNIFVLFVILLKCAHASGDTLGIAFKEAVGKGNFEWLGINVENWKWRNDLLDYVITKGANFTAKLIQKSSRAKEHVLAALFEKGEGMIDNVLGGIKHDDKDLQDLTTFRLELVCSPEKFFRILDRVKDPKNQETAVWKGVVNLLTAGKHGLVVLLVDALGKRTYNGDRLKNVAIQMAFYQGVRWGNQDIMRLYCEHPAITSEKYAEELYASWNYGNPNQVFQLLVKQADQGDLDVAKEKYAVGYFAGFRQALDKAPKPVPSAGSRHRRSIKKAVLKMLAPTTEPSVLDKLDNIIEEYLLEGEEGTKKDESEGQETGTENRTD